MKLLKTLLLAFVFFSPGYAALSFLTQSEPLWQGRCNDDEKVLTLLIPFSETLDTLTNAAERVAHSKSFESLNDKITVLKRIVGFAHDALINEGCIQRPELNKCEKKRILGYLFWIHGEFKTRIESMLRDCIGSINRTQSRKKDSEMVEAAFKILDLIETLENTFNATKYIRSGNGIKINILQSLQKQPLLSLLNVTLQMKTNLHLILHAIESLNPDYDGYFVRFEVKALIHKHTKQLEQKYSDLEKLILNEECEL